MKVALVVIAPFFVLGLVALAIPILIAATPFLIYDRRCKMRERLELGEVKEEKPNFLKSGFSLVNEWANKKSKN